MPDFVLPHDIVADIIDYFALRKETDQIKKLSSVSKFFRHHCRKHIFKSISTGDRSYSRAPPVDKFVDLLFKHPDVAKYIQKLDMDMGTDDLQDIALQQNLDTVLPLLTSLSSLRLSATSTSALASWDSLPAISIRSALPKLLLSASAIHTLTIQNFSDFSLTDVHEAIFLRTLNLYRVHLLPNSSFDLDSTPQGPNLDDINRPLSRLESHGDEQNFAQLLSEIIAPQYQTLKHLQLYSVISCNMHCPYAGICTALMKLEKRDILSSLSIHITLRGENPWIPDKEWAALPDVLLKPGWGSLKKLDIVVNIHSRIFPMDKVFGLRHTHLSPFFIEKTPFLTEFKVLLFNGGRVVGALTEMSPY
ncbi:hypothetical protein CVT24_005060 [Panaeolus cyanescens]|uniref:F-box domain-containing protein n=1 Tax=Panaeolus cyanescens TaxID=181874 RepID=A0A409YAY6_9AGAR|nr:hypothetical protein CVT24_005060 [Panaeolus cyanescens]